MKHQPALFAAPERQSAWPPAVIRADAAKAAKLSNPARRDGSAARANREIFHVKQRTGLRAAPERHAAWLRVFVGADTAKAAVLYGPVPECGLPPPRSLSPACAGRCHTITSVVEMAQLLGAPGHGLAGLPHTGIAATACSPPFKLQQHCNLRSELAAITNAQGDTPRCQHEPVYRSHAPASAAARVVPRAPLVRWNVRSSRAAVVALQATMPRRQQSKGPATGQAARNTTAQPASGARYFWRGPGHPYAVMRAQVPFARHSTRRCFT